MTATVDAIASMKTGDVFYYKGRRHTFERFIPANDGFYANLVGRTKHCIFTYRLPDEYAAFPIRIVPSDKVRKPAKRNTYAFSKVWIRPTGFEYEANDCTVRALASATGQSYQQAHAYLRSRGRKDKHGFACSHAYTNWTDGVYRLKMWSYGDKYAASMLGVETLGQWIKSGLLPARCIIITRGHAFASVDGVICDSQKTGTGSRVHSIYELVKT